MGYNSIYELANKQLWGDCLLKVLDSSEEKVKYAIARSNLTTLVQSECSKKQFDLFISQGVLVPKNECL